MKGENTNTHQPISACDLLYGNHFLVELHWKMKDMFKMGYLGGGKEIFESYVQSNSHINLLELFITICYIY